MADGIQLGV